MSFFLDATVAGRCARTRPDIGPLIIDRVRVFHFPERQGWGGAGCGMRHGYVTRVLKAAARRAVGTDISREMLQQAVMLDKDKTCVEAPAERLPFRDHSFDLITASLAYHWFDRGAFLSEARHVLRPGGWLIIYNSRFLGQMRESPVPRSNINCRSGAGQGGVGGGLPVASGAASAPVSRSRRRFRVWRQHPVPARRGTRRNKAGGDMSIVFRPAFVTDSDPVAGGRDCLMVILPGGKRQSRSRPLLQRQGH